MSSTLDPLQPLPLPTHRRKLTTDEMVTLRTLIGQNVPLWQIAEQLQVTEGVLRANWSEARARMEAASQIAVDSWVTAMEVAGKKGFHQPAKDFLTAVKVIEPKPEIHAPQITVQVGFAMPGLPASPPTPPTFDVTPVASQVGDGRDESDAG